MSFDAVILCGGRAQRLGGVDKATVVLAGRPLLERVAEAVAGARRIIAVGPRRHVPLDVVWTCEAPPGGGPAAAVAAGLDLVDQDLVAVVAVDLPLLRRDIVDRLASEAAGGDGAILRDGSGRPQFLAGVYKTEPLRRALGTADNRDRAMKDVIASLDLRHVDDPVAARDCDTWDEVRAAEAALERAARATPARD